MIAVDTNILVYAHRADSQWHGPAADCLKQLSEGGVPWLIPWPCIHEFIAIVTHARIYNPPTPLEVAIGQVEAWLESPGIVLASESSMHWETLESLLSRSRAAGPVVHDARIAAICLDHGAGEILTADRNFSRFPDLKVCNPLV